MLSSFTVISLSPQSFAIYFTSATATSAATLTGMERTILQYYMGGYTVKDIPELARISASTVKTHNRNLYRKLGVDSFDELKVYIELFAACGRSGELLKR